MRFPWSSAPLSHFDCPTCIHLIPDNLQELPTSLDRRFLLQQRSMAATAVHRLAGARLDSGIIDIGLAGRDRGRIERLAGVAGRPLGRGVGRPGGPAQAAHEYSNFHDGPCRPFCDAGRLGPQTRAFRSIGSRASLQLRTCQRSLPGNRPTNASSTDCQYCSSRGVREAVLRETARQDCLTAQCFSTATQMFLSKRASYDESCKGAEGANLPPHDLVAGHTW